MVRAVIMSFITGVFEELFFRVYLFTRLKQSGISVSRSSRISTLLFSLGHIYQGIPGFIGSIIIGELQQREYIRRPNFLVIAMAHGLYNSCVIALVYLSQS